MADNQVNIQVNPSGLKTLNLIKKTLQSIADTPVRLDFDIDTSSIEKAGKMLGQLGSGTMQKIPELMGRMAKETVNIDTAMASLYKSTDEAGAKYTRFLNNAGSASKSVGRDMSSYISQTDEWAKRGYSLDQSAKLSKSSSV